MESHYELFVVGSYLDFGLFDTMESALKVAFRNTFPGTHEFHVTPIGPTVHNIRLESHFVLSAVESL